MKKLLALFLLFWFECAFAQQNQVLIISKTYGCDNFGGHTMSGPISDTLEVWATQMGLPVTVVEADNDSWGNLNPSDFCLVIFSYSSGTDVITTSQEESFLQTFTGNFITLHSGGGDTERHSSISSCSAADIFDWFAENVSGASLRNGACNQKHECNGNIEMCVPNTNALNDPMVVGLPQSFPLNDEFYYLSPLITGIYWNSANQIIWEIMENGPGPSGTRIPVVWRTNNSINISLGHTNEIQNVTGLQYQILRRAFELQATCSTPFAIGESKTEGFTSISFEEPKYSIEEGNIILTYPSRVKNYVIYSMQGKELDRGYMKDNQKIPLYRANFPCVYRTLEETFVIYSPY